MGGGVPFALHVVVAGIRLHEAAPGTRPVSRSRARAAETGAPGHPGEMRTIALAAVAAKKSDGWEVGTGPSYQKGLMAGVGIQGSKITRIRPR
jgi:hypothetical protein